MCTNPLYSLILCSILLFFTCQINSVSSICNETPLNYDPIPNNLGVTAGLISNQSITTPYINTGCSELITIYTQSTPYLLTEQDPNTPPSMTVGLLNNTALWPRINCPHLLSGLTNFETSFTGLSTGSNVVIPSGSNILLRACSIPSNVQYLNRILIESGASLIFDDANIILNVREIWVAAGGKLLIGSETCRLYANININFYGSAADSTTINSADGTGLTSKGIINNGELQVHGKLYFPTWTKLSNTANATNTLLYLQEVVNWEVGQQILITPTIQLDCPDQFSSYCIPCYDLETDPVNCPNYPNNAVRHQNEVRTIVATSRFSSGSVIQIDSPLVYKHYAGFEYQAEVVLLSRRILFNGIQSNDNFGGHTINQGQLAIGQFSGVQAINMGQLNVLGRYPFHFHLMYNSTGSFNSYYQDCSVVNSNFRAFVIHGTNNTRVSRNICFNVTGNAFYLEDGVEENNLLEYNFAAHIHPVQIPAAQAFDDYGQGGQQFQANSGLLIPADTAASGFYALNAMNSWIGNGASGGWSGFAFPNAPGAMGNFAPPLAEVNYYSPYSPMNRNLKRFIGNSAHSTGFYWGGHGSGIYTGGWLYYDSSNVQNYISGRFGPSADERFSTELMVFEHCKVFLSNYGIGHWGNLATVHTSEFHDNRVSVMMFGSAAFVNSLVNGGTPNLQFCYLVCHNWNLPKMGFQYYDTWVQTILSGITFRNFSSNLPQDPTYGQPQCIAIESYTDAFLNQGINALARVKFENTAFYNRIRDPSCDGPVACDGTYRESGKFFSVWDFDGSLLSNNLATIMGSNQTFWDVAGLNCVSQPEWSNAFTCDWMTETTVGYITLTLPNINQGCDTTDYPAQCNGNTADYTTGLVTQWGPNGLKYNVTVGAWTGVSGFTNIGWYWRPQISNPSLFHGYDGARFNHTNPFAPSYFEIGSNGGLQIGLGNFIVLAVAYPKTTTFKVNIVDVFDNNYVFTTLQQSTLTAVQQNTEVLNPYSEWQCLGSGVCTNIGTGAVGPAWAFDSNTGYLYIRVVNVGCYMTSWAYLCADNANFFYSGGVQIPNITQGYAYQIYANCTGCPVQATAKNIKFYQVPNIPPSVPYNAYLGTSVSSMNTNFDETQFESANFKVCVATPPPTPTALSPSSTPNNNISTATSLTSVSQLDLFISLLGIFIFLLFLSEY